MGGGVGGVAVRSGASRFKLGRVLNLACLGRSDRPGGKAWVAWRRGLVAVHGRVRHGTDTRVCAREHQCHSRRSGRHGHVGVASPQHGAGWVRGDVLLWNWS
jgi:hypothetical protein